MRVFTILLFTCFVTVSLVLTGVRANAGSHTTGNGGDPTIAKFLQHGERGINMLHDMERHGLDVGIDLTKLNAAWNDIRGAYPSRLSSEAWLELLNPSTGSFDRVGGINKKSAEGKNILIISREVVDSLSDSETMYHALHEIAGLIGKDRDKRWTTMIQTEHEPTWNKLNSTFKSMYRLAKTFHPLHELNSLHTNKLYLCTTSFVLGDSPLGTIGVVFRPYEGSLRTYLMWELPNSANAKHFYQTYSLSEFGVIETKHDRSFIASQVDTRVLGIRHNQENILLEMTTGMEMVSPSIIPRSVFTPGQSVLYFAYCAPSTFDWIHYDRSDSYFQRTYFPISD